jgi:RNA polymerase sigma-70 factor (ECF subfamily)
MVRVARIHRFVASVFTAGRTAGEAQSITVAEIHDAHADFVWRTLQRLGIPGSDLEDVLQEVFLVVHRRLHTFDRSSRLTTWLYGICMRVAAAHRRRAYFRRERATPTFDDTLADEPGRDPESLALREETRSRFERAVDTLSLEKRAVFVMFEIDGLSTNQIAEIIGTPVGTVYSRLSVARADFVRAVERQAKRDDRRRRP